MAGVQDQGPGRHGEGNMASLSLSLTLQEVSSVRATLQMDPQGAQERQQQVRWPEGEGPSVRGGVTLLTAGGLPKRGVPPPPAQLQEPKRMKGLPWK